MIRTLIVIIMNNTRKSSDLIEVLVKKRYGIKLTEDEEKLYESLDADIIETIMILIDSDSFLYEIQNILKKLNKTDSFSLNVNNIDDNNKNKVKVLV